MVGYVADRSDGELYESGCFVVLCVTTVVIGASDFFPVMMSSSILMTIGPQRKVSSV